MTRMLTAIFSPIQPQCFPDRGGSGSIAAGGARSPSQREGGEASGARAARGGRGPSVPCPPRRPPFDVLRTGALSLPKVPPGRPGGPAPASRAHTARVTIPPETAAGGRASRGGEANAREHGRPVRRGCAPAYGRGRSALGALPRYTRLGTTFRCRQGCTAGPPASPPRPPTSPPRPPTRQAWPRGLPSPSP